MLLSNFFIHAYVCLLNLVCRAILKEIALAPHDFVGKFYLILFVNYKAMDIKLMLCREFPIMADLSDELCLLYQQSQTDRVTSLTH